MESFKFNYEFMSGFRKNSKLLVLTDENQLFRQRNVYKDYTRYKCYLETCNVTVSLKANGECEQLSQERHHNHPPPVDIIKKCKLIGNVKHECEKEAATKRKGVREIFDEVCLKNKDSAAGVSFPKMKRQLQRIRNSGKPKNPASPCEIKVLFENTEFFKEYGMSKHIEKPFYQTTMIEDNFAYSVFVSPTISCLIQKKYKGRRYLIDGTFKTFACCGYKKLLVIHFHYMNHTFPFIYVLLTKKSKESYKHLFQFINNNLFQFEAAAFHTDYEMELRKALGEVFPTVSQNGCWFHYSQALRRKSQQIKGFGSLMNNSADCNKWYRKMLSLPLLRPDHIEEMFLILKTEVLELSQGKQECLNIFLAYFEKQWMSKITPSRFSVHNEIVRTTSSVEDFNSKLSRKLEKQERFPQFVEVIREEDFEQSVLLAQASAGVLNVLPLNRAAQRHKDSKVSELTERLRRGQIALTDFMTSIINKDNYIFETDEIIEEPAGDDFSETEDMEENEIICVVDPRNVLCSF